MITLHVTIVDNNNNYLISYQFTNPEKDLRWCTIPSTVAGHHTDIVLLIVQYEELNGCVGCGKHRHRCNWWRGYDDVIINHCSITGHPFQCNSRAFFTIFCGYQGLVGDYW